MSLRRRASLVIFTTVLCGALRAQPAVPNDAALLRVLDVGQALSVVGAFPGGHYVVFDAGDDVRGNPVLDGVREMVPDDEEIDLLVISHPDFDHLNDALSLLDAYRGRIRRIVRTGFAEDASQTWQRLDSTITARAAAGELVDVNLQRTELPRRHLPVR